MPTDSSLLSRIKMFEEQTPEKTSNSSHAFSRLGKKSLGNSISNDSNEGAEVSTISQERDRQASAAAPQVPPIKRDILSKNDSKAPINGYANQGTSNKNPGKSQGSRRVLAYFKHKVENDDGDKTDDVSLECSSSGCSTVKTSSIGQVVSKKSQNLSTSPNEMWGVVLRKSSPFSKEKLSPPNELKNVFNDKKVKDIEPKKISAQQPVQTTTKRLTVSSYPSQSKPPTPNYRGDHRFRKPIEKKESRNVESDSSRDDDESRDRPNEKHVYASEPIGKQIPRIVTKEDDKSTRVNPWGNISLRKTPPNCENSASNRDLASPRGKQTSDVKKLSKTSGVRTTISFNQTHSLGKPPTPTSTLKARQSSSVSSSGQFSFPAEKRLLAKEEQSPGHGKKQLNNNGKMSMSTIENFDACVSLENHSVAASGEQENADWDNVSLQKGKLESSLVSPKKSQGFFTSTEIRDDCSHAIEVEQVEKVVSKDCPTDEVTVAMDDQLVTKDITKEMTVENILLQDSPSIDALSSVSRDSDDTQGTLQLISFLSIKGSGSRLEFNPLACEAAPIQFAKSELTQDPTEPEVHEINDFSEDVVREKQHEEDVLPSDSDEGIEVVRSTEVDSELHKSHPKQIGTELTESEQSNEGLAEAEDNDTEKEDIRSTVAGSEINNPYPEQNGTKLIESEQRNEQSAEIKKNGTENGVIRSREADSEVNNSYPEQTGAELFESEQPNEQSVETEENDTEKEGIRSTEADSEVNNSYPEQSETENIESMQSTERLAEVEESDTEKEVCIGSTEADSEVNISYPEQTGNEFTDSEKSNEGFEEAEENDAETEVIRSIEADSEVINSYPKQTVTELTESEESTEDLAESNENGAENEEAEENDAETEVIRSIEADSEVINSYPKQTVTELTESEESTEDLAESNENGAENEVSRSTETDSKINNLYTEQIGTELIESEQSNEESAEAEENDTDKENGADNGVSTSTNAEGDPSIVSLYDETKEHLVQVNEDTNGTIVEDASQSLKVKAAKDLFVKTEERTRADEDTLKSDADLPPRSPRTRGRRMKVIRSIKNRSHIRAARRSEDSELATTTNAEKQGSSVLQKKWNINAKAKLREKSTLNSVSIQANCESASKIATADAKTVSNNAHKRALAAKRQKLRKALKQHQYVDHDAYGDDASVVSVDTQSSRVSSVLSKYRASPTPETQSSTKVSRGVRMARAINITNRTARGRSPSSSSSVKKAGRSPSPCPSLGCVSTQSSIAPPVIIGESQVNHIQRPVPRRLIRENTKFRKSQLL